MVSTNFFSQSHHGTHLPLGIFIGLIFIIISIFYLNETIKRLNDIGKSPFYSVCFSTLCESFAYFATFVPSKKQGTFDMNEVKPLLAITMEIPQGSDLNALKALHSQKVNQVCRPVILVMQMFLKQRRKQRPNFDFHVLTLDALKILNPIKLKHQPYRFFKY